MKFDCGPTFRDQLLAWREWHKHFALVPRRVGPSDCRWLETIERRLKNYSDYTGDIEWEYRACTSTEDTTPTALG
jgi:hypothetical protein